MKAINFIIVLSLLIISAGQAAGQDLIVYPAKGQSQKQMEKDKFFATPGPNNRAGLIPCRLRRPHRRRRLRDLRPGVSSGAEQEARRLAQPSVESQAAGAEPEREPPLVPSPAAFSAA